MSLARPSLFVPELLSQVPSNSFEQVYHRYQPVNPPHDGTRYASTNETEIIFNIAVPPNEYIDFTKAYFNVGAIHTIAAQPETGAGARSYQGAGRVPQTGTPTSAQRMIEAMFVKNLVVGRKQSRLQSVHTRWGAWVVSRSQENVNTGSLTLDMNSDSGTAHVFNNLKCLLAKRDYDPKEDRIKGLESANCSFGSQRQGFNIQYTTSNVAGSVGQFEALIAGEPADYRIPLSMLSELARCPSLVPLGFFSSISVNAYQLRITLPQFTATGINPVVYLPTGVANNANHQGVSAFSLALSGSDGYYSPQIVLPSIRNLSMESQELMDSLYSKRVTQNINGVEVPLSLRLNTLGYRLFGVNPLNGNQGRYTWTLPMVDSSVRALAFMIYKPSSFSRHFTDDGNAFVPDAEPYETQNSSNLPYGVTVPSDQLRVTNLEVNVGTRNITNGCVRDYRRSDTVVQDWLALQERRSGYCFSAFPYWKECRETTCQSDVRKQQQWGVPQCEDELLVIDNANGSATDDRTVGRYVQAGCYNVQYGVISLENSNCEGDDLLDATKAKGLNLNNVGSIRVSMDISHVVNQFATDASTRGQEGLAPGPIGDDYKIVWMSAYDKVLEVSPAGVQLIQQEVLSF